MNARFLGSSPSRIQRLALASLVFPLLAFLSLGGCGLMEPRRTSTSYPPFAGPILLDNLPRRLAREHAFRYVCESGAPLSCVCDARLGRDCECSC